MTRTMSCLLRLSLPPPHFQYYVEEKGGRGGGGDKDVRQTLEVIIRRQTVYLLCARAREMYEARASSCIQEKEIILQEVLPVN